MAEQACLWCDFSVDHYIALRHLFPGHVVERLHRMICGDRVVVADMALAQRCYDRGYPTLLIVHSDERSMPCLKALDKLRELEKSEQLANAFAPYRVITMHWEQSFSECDGSLAALLLEHVDDFPTPIYLINRKCYKPVGYFPTPIFLVNRKCYKPPFWEGIATMDHILNIYE